MYQLRDKQALLASTGKLGGLHRTPADAPLHNQVVMKLDGKFSEAGAFDTKVSVTAQGDSDLALRAAFRGFASVAMAGCSENDVGYVGP